MSASAQIDRGFARIDEGLVHYRERPGDGAEPAPMLMLHPSPGSSRAVETLLLAFPGGRRIIAPDTLGNGDSAPPAATQPDLAYYADALDRFCDAMSLGAVDIFGIHTGAHIALELAARSPTRVRRIVLDGVLALSDGEREEYLANYAPPRRPDAHGSQFFWAWQYLRDQMIFFPHFRKDPEHLRVAGAFDPQFLHDLTLDLLKALPTYHLAYEAVFRHDLDRTLPGVRCPVLWLDTGEDYLAAGRRKVLECIPHCETRPVSHEPGALGAAIDAFCSPA